MASTVLNLDLPWNPMIERDAQTGRRYLKLALPEEEAMQSVFAAAAPLLELLGTGLAARDAR